MDRVVVDTDTLLKAALVLAVVWIALEVLDALPDLAFGVFGVLRPFLGVLVLVLVVLYLLDRL